MLVLVLIQEHCTIEAANGERSPDGAEHFPAMLATATELMETEPTLTTHDGAKASTPTLALVGDDDLIELAHTVAL